MKYLKTFEHTNQPEKGDYILDSIVPNRIGRILSKNTNYYTVEYLTGTLIYFVDYDKVTAWSKNKKALLLTNKYNI